MICIRTYKKDYDKIILLLKSKGIQLDYNTNQVSYKYVVMYLTSKYNSAWKPIKPIASFPSDHFPNQNSLPHKRITSKDVISNPELLDALIFDLLL